MKILSGWFLFGRFTVSFALLGLLISSCGGGGGSSNNSSSVASSAASSHVFVPTPVTPALNGTWPNVKISTSSTKTLKFEWTAATNATYYKLMKKVDAAATYQQVGTDFTATTVIDAVSIHLTDWVNMRYKVQACDVNNSCTDSTEIVANSAMLGAITYVKASNSNANDWFGWSVAISADGSTMAVGAPGESSHATGVNGNDTSNDSPTSGAVYVFVKSNGNWVQEAYIKASNTEPAGDSDNIQNPNDRFGYKVALSADGSRLAVSAINEDSPSIGVNCPQGNAFISGLYPLNSGAVYVFVREPTSKSWSQEAYIKPILPEISENGVLSTNLLFGLSLSFSGDGKTLAVGTVNQGGGVWTGLAGILNARNSSQSSSTNSCVDNTGSTSSNISSLSSSSSSSSSSTTTNSSTSSSSSSVVLGGSKSGAVYVYVLGTNGWEEDALIKASDLGQNGYFGNSIALSNDGSWLAVGAIGVTYTNTSSTSSGASASSETVALGAGAVYVFNKTNNLWAEKSKFFASPAHTFSQFGSSLSISADGTVLAVGAALDFTTGSGVAADPTLGDINQGLGVGACYIFRRSGETWSQADFIKPSNPTFGYLFGFSISLSADGTVLAVGSPYESSQAIGINGDQQDTASNDSGAVYVFKYSNSAWAQKSYVKAPVNHKLDRFGYAVSLDATGANLVIGSYREPSNATGINGDRTNTSADATGAVFIY